MAEKRIWEFEVSDYCSCWGYGSKSYKPGIYTTDDPALAAAAEKVYGVHVRELREGEESERTVYPEAVAEVGPLEIKDLRTPSTRVGTCDKCGKVFQHQHKCLGESE